MKRIFSLLTISCCFWSMATSQSPVTFASYPALSPDGETVLFSYDGDLWKVSAEGGQAYRLTAMPGREIAPRISPDGKWLAFSSDQNGNSDVYVMPLEGGEIRQLTYHSGSDIVDSWSWDSREIYFTSTRANRFTSFKVSREGGTPTRIFGHYFNTVHNVVETPKGELLFNDTWESLTAAHRKRYKGAFNPDILSYNPRTKEMKQLTDYEGKDFWATADRDGNIFFASDEGNGEYNLYTFKEGEKTALTAFETSVKRPFVSADGSGVVFEKDYQLYIYRVATGESKRLDITLGRNPVLDKENEYDVKDKISFMDVSPDGKKLAFVSRGELFVSDIGGKFIRQMPGNGERAVEVKWLKDNKTLLYNQTRRGYLNWFTRTADGSDEPVQRTDEMRSNRDISLNPEMTQAVYVSGRDELRMMDLKTLESKTVTKDEIWAFQNSKPSFSPDGEYLLYTARRNFEEDVFIYHIKSGESRNLTNTDVSESSPVWSPDGRYIYFASNRTRPSYPTGMRDASIYRLALDYYEEPFREEEFEKLFEDQKQKEEKSDDDEAEDKDGKPAVYIETEGLSDRIERVTGSFGTQSRPVIIEKGKKTHVLFYSNQEEGKPAMYRKTYEPFEESVTKKVAGGSFGNVVEVSGSVYVLSRGSIHKLNIDSGKMERTDISFKFNRNLEAEFRQMFEETWAGIDENFYDSDFHGLDWQKTRKQYEAYLPLLNTRADLRILLNDMLGELNSSHMGFNSHGPEERPEYKAVTNEIGVVFHNERPMEVAEVLRKGPAGRKGVDIREGDILRRVNGVTVDPTMNRAYYFTFPSLKSELSLTFERDGREIQTRVRPQINAAYKNLLYDEWIAQNRSRVDEWSDHRIAYSHMKNMTAIELERFLVDMTRYESSTEGTILDLRYNTGGNVHDEVLRFLSQKPYLQWQYREGTRAPQSNFAPAGKPIVLLVNQQSLSDAEMTTAGFKALELGTVIGTETYRWIIFTSAKGLVDGSGYRVPAWGCFTLDGDDLEKTGVSPDIFVENTFLDKINNKDPQLDRAVKEILKALK